MARAGTFSPVRTEVPQRAVVAVDCNGAGCGPRRGRRRRCDRGGPGRARDPVRARRASWASRRTASRSWTRPCRSPRARIPSARRGRHPGPRSCRPPAPSPTGRAQALVCAGGTGAALAAGSFNIKRARGIYRPALAIPLPVPRWPVTLLDVGASVEARREHLVQFAFMGAALSRVVLGVERPRVGLLSNGEEPERGSALVRGRSRRAARAHERHGRRVRVRRQRRGRRRGRWGRGRDRDRRLHREHRAEADGGRLPDDARRRQGRCDVLASAEARAARCCAVR